jgi:Protein of unknown function (DUF3887)
MKKFASVTASLLVTVGLVGWQPLSLSIPAAKAQTTTVSQSITYERDIQQKAENFVDALAQQKFDNATKNLHQTMKPEESTFDVELYWQDLLKQTGKFQKRVKSTVDGNLVLVTIQFDKVTEDLFIIFDDNGQIVGVDFPAI